MEESLSIREWELAPSASREGNSLQPLSPALLEVLDRELGSEQPALPTRLPTHSSSHYHHNILSIRHKLPSSEHHSVPYRGAVEPSQDEVNLEAISRGPLHLQRLETPTSELEIP